MTPEWTAIYITVIGAIGTVFNVYLNLKMSGQMDRLKLWVRENFVARNDMTTYLAPLKEGIQLRDSASRLREH